jgi:hypothetical protein
MESLNPLAGFEDDFIPLKLKEKEVPKGRIPFDCGESFPGNHCTVYSETFWLPEDVETLLDDMVQGMFGG